jgi:hypothetical protein
VPARYDFLCDWKLSIVSKFFLRCDLYYILPYFSALCSFESRSFR